VKLRRRLPLLDHLIRAYQRYQADTGDRLAAGVTFYWFLSLFPILLLVLAGYGYLHAGETRVELNARLAKALGDFLPQELVTTLTDTLAGAKGKAGLLGLGGLLISGLGWIDALREAIRTIWHQNVKAGNFVVRKVVDVVALVGLFATIIVSASVTALVGSGPKFVLEQLGVDKTTGAKLLLQVIGIALGVLVDVALFLYLFVRLARVGTPVRQVLKGAVFGAIGFGLIKLLGGYYVQRTTTSGKATYGVFAVVVGLLLFLNLITRLVLLAAAFTVTGPFDDDRRPSGTADAEQARKAGIPEEYAGTHLNLVEDGAPTPLRAAVQDTEAMERSWQQKAADPVPAVPTAPPAPTGPLPGEAPVRAAANALVVLGAAVGVGVLVHAARTVRQVLRR
jgi:membrane protein